MQCESPEEMEDSAAAAEVTALASNSVKVNGIEVKCDNSKSTIINISFSQPAAPSCFQDFGTSVGKALQPLGDGFRCRMGPPPMPTVNTITEVKVALQASRIVLGVVAISLGVLLSHVHQSRSFEKGVAFWTGIPFILSGILSLGKEKTTSRFWIGIASLMNLASLIISIAGVIVIANDLTWWYNHNWSSYQLCDAQRNEYYNGGYGGGNRATPPTYEDFYRKQQCREITESLLGLFREVRVLLLVVTIFVLIVNLCSGLSDLIVRCGRASPRQGEGDPAPLPPAYEEKKGEFQTI